MTVAQGKASDGVSDEELRLARAAAAGDGEAFARLYERYEGRAFNLAFRITGSREDAADAVQDAFVGVLRRLPDHDGGDLAFGSYVFTATRNACYDLIAKRRRAQPSDSIPESATPLGSGAGGLGLDPGDPDDDPTRSRLLDSQRGEIRVANERLPERQREVLALRELEELSYDEIAAIMDMNRNSVAQLISRARLNLRAELRGAALESIPAAAAECERALPLIARRDDGELEDSDDGAWLDAHLGACAGCRLRREAMQEAGVSYRAWAPIAAAPGLFEATMAEAAEAVGADWSETIARRAAVRARAARPSRRRPAVIGAALVVLLLLGLVTARELDNLEPREEPAVAERIAAPVRVEQERPAPRRSVERPQQGADASTPSAAGEPVAAPPVVEPGGDERPAAKPPRRAGSQVAPDGSGRVPSEPAGRQPAPTPVPTAPTPVAEPEAAQPEPPRPETEAPREPEPPAGEPEPPPHQPPLPGGDGSLANPPPPPPVP